VTENSAEREAENILREAARAIQTEQCPQGEECAVHHRVDEEYIQEDAEYARYITYIGDYVVLTEDNHIFDSPQFLLKVLLGGVKKADLPPRWETSIFHVGDGAIGDLVGRPIEEQGNALRYAKTHDDWGLLKSEHETTVSALTEGLIDVSKPYREEN
jgi:hypothetical protein